MAILRKYLAQTTYTKIDNNVTRNKDITDYGYRLYAFISGFKNGFQLNDAYIMQSLGWSRDKVSRAKKNLVENDLILVQKIDRATYLLYVGTTKVKAQQVKDNWEVLEKL